MKLRNLLIATILCSSLSITSLAHSGRTDSSGGHYNRSTGEYHYHHGYSAHQHTDKDGDGDLDCPYKFTDKTTSSSSSKGSNTQSSTSSQNTTRPSYKVETTKKEDDEIDRKSFVTALAVNGPILGFILLIRYFNKTDENN